MLEGRRIAVVVPALNEGPRIRRVIETMPRFVDAIWLVDDGSSDDTQRQASLTRDPRLRLLVNARPGGVGAAICRGYRCAFQDGADVAAVMAGDGQMAPGELQAVVAPVLHGDVDYSKGDRLQDPQITRRMPWTRLLGNHLLSWLTRKCTGLQLADSQCGYTALGRSAASRLPLDRLWPGYGYPNDLLGWAAMLELRVRDVPVSPIYGAEISGVRLRHALGLVPALLLRVLLRRVARRFGLAVDTQRSLETPSNELQSQPTAVGQPR